MGDAGSTLMPLLPPWLDYFSKLNPSQASEIPHFVMMLEFDFLFILFLFN